MSLDLAIIQLTNELEVLQTPAAGTTAWWVLRAKSTGLSLLRAMKAQGLEDDLTLADAYRKDIRSQLIAKDTP